MSNNKRIYRCYRNIKTRCENKKSHNYKNYGQRGIICLWNTFEEFKNDMYESYLEHCEEFGEKQTTIDRINVNGNYCKENCRWATMKEQANNTRKNIKTLNSIMGKFKIKICKILKQKKVVVYGCYYKNYTEARKVLGLSHQVISRRVKHGITKYVGQYDLNGNLLKIWHSKIDIKKEHGISSDIILKRCEGRHKYPKPLKGYNWSYIDKDILYYKINNL